MPADTVADAVKLAALHEKWKVPPKDMVGKLPKPTKRDNPKGKCGECGGWHGLPAVHLDYQGHADVTEVLLREDPLWEWRPMGVDEHGVPVVLKSDQGSALWIWLTIFGKTQPGVGTVENKGGPEVLKELISDALRNTAMRFGIGLALWSKSEWGPESQDDSDQPTTSAPSSGPSNERPTDDGPADALDPGALFMRGNKPALRQALAIWCKDQGSPVKPIDMNPEQRASYLNKILELEEG